MSVTPKNKTEEGLPIFDTVKTVKKTEDGLPILKKKEQPVASASGSVEVGLQPGTENTSPSTSPLKSTSEGVLDVNAVTAYARGLNDPAEIKRNAAQPTKEQIALQISKQRPLLQVNKDGSKAKTKDEGIAETAEKIQADRTQKIQEVQGRIQSGEASKEEVMGLYDYEEARPFLQSYINAYADKESLPATGDVLAPGAHWDSAWKNSTFEQRPLAVQKIDAATKYADSLINAFNGGKINYLKHLHLQEYFRKMMGMNHLKKQ